MVILYYTTLSRKLRFGGIWEWVPIEISIPHTLENTTVALEEHLQVSLPANQLEWEHWCRHFHLNTLRFNFSLMSFWSFLLRNWTKWNHYWKHRRHSVMFQRAHFWQQYAFPDSCLRIYKSVTSESILWTFLEAAPASQRQGKGKGCRYVIHLLMLH